MSVPAGDIVEADVSDTYGLVPGQLEVTKTIAGPLAGHQGTVVIDTTLQRHRPPPHRHRARGSRRRPVAHLPEYPHAGQLCGHRDRGREHQHRLGRRHWQVAHHHHPARREWGRSHHRHLRRDPRLAARHQDDRRPARRPPGTGHHPRGLQRHRPVAGLRDRRRGPGRAASRTASTASRPARCAPSPRPRTAPRPPSRRPWRAIARR